MPNRIFTVTDKEGASSQMRSGDIWRVTKVAENTWKVELNQRDPVHVDDRNAKLLMKKIASLG